MITNNRAKTITEMREELAELRTAAQEFTQRSAEELTPEDVDRASFIAGQIAGLNETIADIEAKMEHLKNSDATEHGTPNTPKRTANTPHDVAMRSVDAAHKSGRLHSAGAETIETLLGQGTPQARSWAERWAIHAGSPAYERAFAKLVADPERGHMMFSGEEAAAFRDVQELGVEQRAMGGALGSAGGFLVPSYLDPAITLTGNGSINPLRQIARVVQTPGAQWQGVTSAGVTSEWTAEAAEMADASPTLTGPNIPVHKGDAFVPFSFELENDAKSLMDELGKLLADGAEQLNATAYTTGTGVGQPKGIVTALIAAGGSAIVAGSGTEALGAQDFYNLQNALPPRFQANATWAANLMTWNTARQFETTNGAIKFPGLHEVPATLLGRNACELSNMDGVVNPAATESNHVALYGDFSNFVIVDSIGTRLELVQHLVGANRRPTGQRGAVMWWRTGSDIVTPNAFRLLNVATAA